MMKGRFVALVGTLVLTVALVAPAMAGTDDGPPVPLVAESEHGSYVVLMKGDPLVASMGRDELGSSEASARGRQMRAEHARVAATVDAAPVNDYTVALNGFSTIVDHDAAQELATHKDVLLVLPDELHQPTTDSSIDFLGLTGGTKKDPAAHDAGVTGENVVVGVIDTGIWPEHPSFADDGSYRPIPQVDVPCEFGNTDHNFADAPFDCNNKLLGARQMLATYRALIETEDFEFDSARDDNGHGTHTASTAAGNANIPASVGVHDLGTVTGVAPRARVVAYKGLGALGGFGSDLAAAIDQAVADGVDVINYSIGGGASLIGADDLAFLFAADAGVFVATSAGNSGSAPATIGGPASVPWLTSVGASTQTRFFEGTVELGNGSSYTGASLTDTVGESPLVDAADATTDGDDLCVPGTLDPEVVEGAIVLCRRGAIARVDKSLAVLQAGGVGMIMYENSDAGDRFTDTHHVPSVHVDNTPGLAIKDYIATDAEPTAAIVDTGAKAAFDPAPSMTAFSSRGPNPVANDLIKPDVTAPGMQILAGASPYADPGGNDFMSIAGTSMSSPHVAGLFALLKQANPKWSAAAAKSALMTTADPDVRNNDRVSAADPFDMGAGHVDLGRPKSTGSAFDPGLVYDVGFNDYLGFLCDAAPEVFGNATATCASLASQGIPTTSTDLNVPSIGVAAVVGTSTVERTVTATANGRHTYTVDVDAPEGFDVTVSPSTFTARKGQEVTYTVTFVNESATVGEWEFGSLTWSGDGYEVRSPIAVKGEFINAPSELSATGETGEVTFDLAFGYTGPYTAGDHGLIPATHHQDEVPFDEDQTFSPDDVGTGAVAHDVTTSGAALLRVVIPPDGVVSPDVDIDLFVHDSEGNLVGSSTNGGTDEQVDLFLPADDTYTVYIHGWQTVEDTTPVDTFVWVLPSDPTADNGSLEVAAPDTAVNNTTEPVTASWNGATAGSWYLGGVSHNSGTDLLGLTLVNIDNRDLATP